MQPMGTPRIHGVAAISTTYGVGELSAISAIGGSYAEHLPVFHLVGMPSMPTQAAHGIVHHTLGDGEFDFFRKMAEPVVCGSAIMTLRTLRMKESLSNRYGARLDGQRRPPLAQQWRRLAAALCCLRVMAPTS
jgi:TPP-dependent 2-oxoacid decarboxylase